MEPLDKKTPGEHSDLIEKYRPLAIKAVVAACSIPSPPKEVLTPVDYPRTPGFHGYDID